MVDPLEMMQSEEEIFGQQKSTQDLEDDILEEYRDAFKYVAEQVDKADEGIRETRVRLYKKLSCYLEGKQLLWWDDDSNSYRMISEANQIIEDGEEIDFEAYAKVANIFKPYIVSVISAITAGTPKVKYIPDNADLIYDIDTAKTYQLIQKRIESDEENEPKELITKALRIKYTDGLVFGYVYPVEDSKLGYYNEPVEEMVKITTFTASCIVCGYQFDSGEGIPFLNNEIIRCPQCNAEEEPLVDIQEKEEKEVVDFNQIPKHRICIDLYGSKNVEIPFFVTDLKQVPVLTLRTEMHYAQAMHQFDLSEKPTSEMEENQWERLPSGYYPDVNDLVTVTQRWYQPWAFNILQEKDLSEQIQQQFPNGAYAVFINNRLVKIYEEELCEHWTTIKDPFSDFLQCVPEGLDLVDIQDMFNELVNLTLDTIEHNIPEIFVRPETLDLDEYKSRRARPGNVSHAKPRSGQSLGSDFYESRSSSLSQEHNIFSGKILELGQFVSGALPSVYGGAIKGGSQTAKEYEMSRAAALQRISPLWSMVKKFYASLMGLAVPMYAALMKEDERFVSELSEGRYINIFIKKSKLQGKIGRVIHDVNEQLPTSWAEERDVLMQLVATKDPVIGQILLHPNNSSLVKDRLGLPGMYIPGDEDREKQLAEISELIKSDPIPNPQFQQFQMQLQQNPQMYLSFQAGQMQAPNAETSSVPIDFEMDNHAVEFETGNSWLKSPTGRAFKEFDELKWKNVYLHTLEHKKAMQMMMQQQAQVTENEETNPIT